MSSETCRAIMVDAESGEVLDGGMPLIDRQKSKHYWGDYFVTLFQGSLRAVVPKLSGEEARVLLYLASTIGIDNEWKVLNQREIAEEIEMHQPNVSRALKELARMNVVLKGARIGKGHAYSLNPHLGWRGNFKKHAPAKHAAPELVAA
jgi:hypothetical protein